MKAIRISWYPNLHYVSKDIVTKTHRRVDCAAEIIFIMVKGVGRRSLLGEGLVQACALGHGEASLSLLFIFSLCLCLGSNSPAYLFYKVIHLHFRILIFNVMYWVF